MFLFAIKKGSSGPNSEKVGFFSISIKKHSREQWLQAVRRELGTSRLRIPQKVCSLHFKVENLKKSLDIGRLTLVERAVPSAFGCGIVRRGDWLGKPANFRGACL